MSSALQESPSQTGGATTSEALRPSDVAPPTRVDTLPQQAATQPQDDGTHVHAAPQCDASPTAARLEGKIPWKEQVVAYAQKARGSVLRKPTLKEHGQQILQGDANAREPAPKA